MQPHRLPWSGKLFPMQPHRLLRSSKLFPMELRFNAPAGSPLCQRFPASNCFATAPRQQLIPDGSPPQRPGQQLIPDGFPPQRHGQQQTSSGGEEYSGLASNLAHLGRMWLPPGQGAAAGWQMVLPDCAARKNLPLRRRDCCSAGDRGTEEDAAALGLRHESGRAVLVSACWQRRGKAPSGSRTAPSGSRKAPSGRCEVTPSGSRKILRR